MSMEDALFGLYDEPKYISKHDKYQDEINELKCINDELKKSYEIVREEFNCLLNKYKDSKEQIETLKEICREHKENEQYLLGVIEGLRYNPHIKLYDKDIFKEAKKNV